jgi:hypothetical protein
MLTTDLDTLARKHASLAAGYRMAGERDLARAHDKVALEARYACDRIQAALAGVEAARPMPVKPVRIATVCGKPAWTKRSVAP